MHEKRDQIGNLYQYVDQGVFIGTIYNIQLSGKKSELSL